MSHPGCHRRDSNQFTHCWCCRAWSFKCQYRRIFGREQMRKTLPGVVECLFSLYEARLSQSLIPLNVLNKYQSPPTAMVTSSVWRHCFCEAMVRKPRKDQIAIIDGGRVWLSRQRMHPDLRVDNWTSRANALISRFEQELPSNIQVNVLFNPARLPFEHAWTI